MVWVKKKKKISFHVFFAFYAISYIFRKTILSHFVFSLRFMLFLVGGGVLSKLKKSHFVFSSRFMLFANIFII